MLQVGAVLDNKYKILSEIGHGGMSVVYLAINERANKTWAVKEVRKDGVVDFESVKQNLIVETDMLKKLNHPNLPSIIDVIDSEDSFLIIMDYIEGTSLQKLLKTSGAQPEEKVVKWAKQLCDVLGYLHNQNPPIIYRDMKPSNVMLKPDGNVMLIDFGTAREFKNRAMVEDTTCLGTRGYAAPEQFGGRGQTDARTDIYGLGATLYHLLTGHSPAEPPYEIKPISYWIPQYAGSGLEKLILKCTQFDPAARYQDCAELMYALEHYRDEDDIIQKKRKKQWRAFLIAAIIGLIGVAGMVASLVLLNGAKQKSYNNLVSMAEKQDSLEASRTYILQAMELDPGNPEVYKVLINKVKNDIDDQKTFTASTSEMMNSILNSSSTGSSTNIDILAREDPAAYAYIMYQIGIWYFFLKGDGEDSFKKIACDNYFSKITVEPYIDLLGEVDFLEKNELTEEQKREATKTRGELATLLQQISEYIDTLESTTGTVNPGEASYSQLFSDLREIVSGNLKEKVGMDRCCVKVYEQIAYWISQNHTNFHSAGVSYDEMRELLNTMETGLKDLKIAESSKIYEYAEAAQKNINDARTSLNSSEN